MAGNLYRLGKKIRRGALFFLGSGLALLLTGDLQTVRGESAGEPVSYVVSFVDEADPNTEIFHSQRGEVLEGTTLKVSFPERLVGRDGHIWISAAESPQYMAVYQAGTQKFYISYTQGEKIPDFSEPEEENRGRLERWIREARKADAAILGREDSWEGPEGVVVSDQSSNNRRIRQLVSALDDSDSHIFYVIGADYTPQTQIIGAEYEAVYSSVEEDSFVQGGVHYEVMQITVRRLWNGKNCRHRWELLTEERPGCLSHGSGTFECFRCKERRTVCLPAAGHEDEDKDGICEQCGGQAASQEPEKLVWKKGDRQVRKVGKEWLFFTCVDEDYHDRQDHRRKAALFFCDSLIRADVDTVAEDETARILSFGETSNYKTSHVRRWLERQGSAGETGLEPVHTGIQTAYTGATKAGEFGQLTGTGLSGREIGYQFMQDRMFCLSVEEALRYREELWKFGSDTDNPETQESSCSQGYYLRTPAYEEDGEGRFAYGKYVYGVDLNGSIHPVNVESGTYGLRPAFAMPQA